MTTTRDTLVAARALIAEPEAWTQGAFAKRADGGNTAAIAPAAICWCARGAIEMASRGSFENENAAVYAFQKANDTPSFIAEWNDAPERTHAEVIAAFDRAIEAAT